MSDDQDIQQLQGDIEHTRSELAETIGQIEERLSPSALQDQVSDIVRQVTDQILSEFSGKSGELTNKINEQVQTAVQSVASSRVEQLIGQAGPAVGGVGKSLWSRLSENPAVGALAAVGIGLLAAEESVRRSGDGGGPSASASTGDASGGMGSTLSGMVGQAGDKVSGLVDSAKQRAQSVSQSVSQSASGAGGTGGGLADQSLASGLLAMGIGFLVGIAAPETETERGAIAPLREKAGEQLDKMGVAGSGQGLLEQAKQTGGDLIGQATQAASGQSVSAQNK